MTPLPILTLPLNLARDVATSVSQVVPRAVRRPGGEAVVEATTCLTPASNLCHPEDVARFLPLCAPEVLA
ncbi:MAG TPA: hypothetical protein PLH11_12635 [Gemmobacter sp.]|nr:hypothetical protein [Gemmobacter sp.]